MSDNKSDEDYEKDGWTESENSEEEEAKRTAQEEFEIK